jgi:hypothetical protein
MNLMIYRTQGEYVNHYTTDEPHDLPHSRRARQPLHHRCVLKKPIQMTEKLYMEKNLFISSIDTQHHKLSFILFIYVFINYEQYVSTIIQVYTENTRKIHNFYCTYRP